MKSLFIKGMLGILILSIITQCDSVSPNTDTNELRSQIDRDSIVATTMGQPVQKVLNWDGKTGAASYKLLVADSEQFTTVLIDTTVKGTSYTAKSLTANTTYYWKVAPVKDGSPDEWSEVQSFTPVNGQLSTTNGLTLIAPENNANQVSVNLRFVWEGHSESGTYEYQLSDSQTFNSVLYKEVVEGSTYLPEDLEYRKRYFWRVKKQGSEDWSEVRAFTTGSPDTEPTEVTLVYPVDRADKIAVNLDFLWNPMPGVSEYEYQLSDNRNFTSILQRETVEGSSFNPGTLKHQKRYHWRVRPAGSGQDWSDVFTFITGIAGEPKRSGGGRVGNSGNSGNSGTSGDVELLVPYDKADKVTTDLTFKWEAASGADNFEYQLSDNMNFTSILKRENVRGNSFKPGGLEHQKRYHWRVRVRGSGNHDWSDVYTFVTGIAGEDNHDGTGSDGSGSGSGGSGSGGDSDGGSDGAQAPEVELVSPADNAQEIPVDSEFEWNNVSGYSEYVYQLASDSEFNSVISESTVRDTYYTPRDIGYGEEYFWRVRVAGNNNSWSDVRRFTTERESAEPSQPVSGSFVSTQNANFVVDGEPFSFVGTNAYYLPNYEKLDSRVVDRAFDLFEETGITVIRMWGFYDGFDCGYSQHDSSENVIQTSPGVYNEDALRDLDRVIAKGKERGIRFIIPFVNYWDELGGICQYNTWAGASNPSTNMEFFISNSQTQRWFRDYISMLLNRVNTVTGVAYKDEPAIFAWQIMNEGRNTGQDPRILRDWYRDIARYIKSIDPNHMVSTGEEGFDEGTPSEYSVGEYSNTYVLRANEGTSYIMNTAIPEIDFGSAHWYPSEFGFGSSVNGDMLRAQRAWLVDHQRIAEDLGKPFYIGEFGLPAWGDERVVEMYDEYYRMAEEINLDGSLLWQLVADGTKCWEFGGNICYPGGREDAQLYNRFRQHVNTMGNRR
jgi:hypothetical protein